MDWQCLDLRQQDGPRILRLVVAPGNTRLLLLVVVVVAVVAIAVVVVIVVVVNMAVSKVIAPWAPTRHFVTAFRTSLRSSPYIVLWASPEVKGSGAFHFQTPSICDFSLNEKPSSTHS